MPPVVFVVFLARVGEPAFFLCAGWSPPAAASDADFATFAGASVLATWLVASAEVLAPLVMSEKSPVGLQRAMVVVGTARKK